MFKDSEAFSGFSVHDLASAKIFYGDKLGLQTQDLPGMGFNILLKNESKIFVYTKENHQPATFTILNFPVVNIDSTIDELVAKGIKFEHYDLGGGAKTDDKGVLRGLAANMGPDIAWFKDPAGNILSVLQEG